MKRRTILSLIIMMSIGTMLTSAPAVRADSLWSGNGSLYTKKVRQFQTGDLVTIIVVEQAKATQNAESSNGETGGFSAGPGVGGWQTVFPLFGTDWDSSFKGKGATSRGGSLTAKLTVEVKGVHPNGILELEGRQVIRVNAEDQILTVKGKVRSEDVSTDNIVMSSNVAEAVIEYQGKGTIGEAQSPGILTKFFHWLF
ncbi:MAG TPA: flagellar basal body L-ring protein FlgH [Bacillota bacterium]|nr:flagellar basal body L-ring protein FlgH [Bacillota bacterium]